MLNEEEDSIHVTFTMTQVPKKASPKPMMIPLAHAYRSEKQRSRVCIFAKDPARELKD